MFIIKHITFVICVLFIISFISPTFTLKKNNDKSKKLPDSIEEESSETEIRHMFDKVKDKASDNGEEEEDISADEMEKLKEKEYDLANELVKKEGKPEISHEAFDKIWNEKKKEYGKHFSSIAGKMLVALKDAAEKIDSEESPETEIRQLFDKAKDKASENEEEKVEISANEMEKLKEKEYDLANELVKKEGKHEISHEAFDKIWDEKKKEYGKHFSSIAGKMLVALKEAAEKIDPEESSETEIRRLFDKAKDKASENEEENEEISDNEAKKLKEKEYELANELVKKEGKPEISHEAFDKIWDEKKKEYGKHFNSIAGKMLVALKEASEKIDSEENSEAEIRHLFEKAKETASENEEGEVEISSDEMEKVKEEEYELANKLNRKEGKPKVSHEAFDKVWNEKKKEYGKHFNFIAGKLLVTLREAAEKIELTTLEASEAPSVTQTQTSDVMKEPSPEDTFILRNAKGKICILAKFQSSITIMYPGKSAEEKVEVTIPNTSHVKGKCKGTNGSSSLQILWEKFIFSLFFNKTNEDEWVASLVELTYDTSGPLFDDAAKRENVTVKSKNVSLFITPSGKSYFCPAQEVILLYREDQHMATVHLKEIHLQPFDVKDGKFSPFHRCSQVVIGGLDEEPFVQDETVPLAVGCTLALITLLILVGFSVHRAYNAAKVDYNTVE